MTREIIKFDSIEVTGGEIPIVLSQDGDDVWSIYIDGVHWLDTPNDMHAFVLFALMRDHITEYVHYEMVSQDAD